MYDVYYTTGGGPYTNAGSDKWVNDWLELIVPNLKVKPILLIHRNKPKNFDEFNYEFPIETYWHGDDIEKFEELCNGARRINILHGHYTPMKSIIDNKEDVPYYSRNPKIYKNYAEKVRYLSKLCQARIDHTIDQV